jgi:hypothetical protein
LLLFHAFFTPIWHQNPELNEQGTSWGGSTNYLPPPIRLITSKKRAGRTGVITSDAGGISFFMYLYNSKLIILLIFLKYKDTD